MPLPASSMDPNIDVKGIANSMLYIDPRISFFLMKYPTLPKDFLLTFTFNTGTLGQQDEQLLISKARCDYLILGLEYTWRRPLFLAESDFRYTEEVAALTIPYLSMFLKIDGCPQYSLSDDLEPLELVARCTAVQGNYDKFRPFVLFDTDQLKGRMRLDRNFDEVTEATPLQIFLVTHGLLMQCNNFNNMTVDLACHYLKKDFGVEVNKKLLPADLDVSLED
jgi:hypothetical protein